MRHNLSIFESPGHTATCVCVVRLVAQSCLTLVAP